MGVDGSAAEIPHGDEDEDEDEVDLRLLLSLL